MLAVFFLLTTGEIFVGEVSGVISPASSEYIVRIIDYAEENDAECLIIRLDTPGGLDASMREIAKKILNAAIPVVIYVSPPGARAASAGVFILYASHIAAMAPGTNVGAAHPVSVGEQQADSVMIEKVTNDAVAYLQAIAKERRRNIEWAEQAVRTSASLDAENAVKMEVCDILAENLADLLEKIDGRSVELQEGMAVLDTRGRSTTKIDMTFKERLLLLLTNPNIAYVLLLLGIYGLFFELQNPGMIVPGVVGAISIILGFYALHLLPVNYAGVALIALSAVLFVLEIHIASHGFLAIGGIVSLILGSVILFNSNIPFFRLSWEVIVLAIIIIAVFFILIVVMGIRAQFRKKTGGKEGIVGEIGIAKSHIGPSGGSVYVHGEFWNAISDGPIKNGAKVRVIAVEEMTLKVQPE